jgi:hypothetical protein
VPLISTYTVAGSLANLPDRALSLSGPVFEKLRFARRSAP